MDCKIYAPPSDEFWTRHSGGGDGRSHDSEHDLAMMVRDFVENGNSGGTDSKYSSDSDSSLPDLPQLADNISYLKLKMDQYEHDLSSIVNSLALSIEERDLIAANPAPCSASCIRFSLVKLLRLSGFDAGVCTSKWQGSGNVPGGDHEYIDIAHCYTGAGGRERLIVDVDFRSHFEIARAVEFYDGILNSLPVIFVGSFSKLDQFLQVMVDAAVSSLKQNSMPLPPWRSLDYLRAKWQSPYNRKTNWDDDHDQNCNDAAVSKHGKCGGHLRSLHLSLLSEIEAERMVKSLNRDRRLLKFEHHRRRRRTLS
ncbi:uncharacterized protein LOC127241532 [Andrographis paniculata]|uniref:uncharacterized protein LOC127241532 n=1 Tax=Andrographis paniculata TaxID=175694 RepID=UPI0021E6F606|nr:uncharacterized protein LOC127241532 [Andrographis paniculata]